MSTLKADTVQSTSGGAATLTKQSAAKFLLTYDAVNSTNDSSLNASSTTDLTTGEFRGNLTNAFASATDQTLSASMINSGDDNGNRWTGFTRGLGAFIGAASEANEMAFSASIIPFCTYYGSDSSNNGSGVDTTGGYVIGHGDLA